MARVYTLTFRDQRGTQGERWNTIRLGPAWYKRLVIGQKVELYDKDQQVFARAIVADCRVGPRDEIIREHAWCNHLYLGQDKIESGERLLKMMPRLYGNLIFKNSKLATVIYLDTD